MGIHFKPVDKNDSEYRVMSVLVIIEMAMTVLVVMVEGLLFYSWLKFVLGLAIFFYFLAAFLVLRIKRFLEPVLYSTLLLIAFSGPIYWSQYHTLTTPGALIHVAALVGCLLIAPFQFRYWVVGLFFTTAFIYSGMNLNDYLQVETIDSEGILSHFYFLVIMGAVSYITLYLRSGYESEKSGMKTFGKHLRELYDLNHIEWDSISSAYDGYLKTGSRLMKADRSLIVKKEWNKWRLVSRAGFDWDGTIDSFSKEYQSQIGDLRIETIMTEPSNLIFNNGSPGNLIVSPIFVEGVFFGHIAFAFDRGRNIKKYDLELAVLIGQNLGYTIGSEEIKDEERKTREALNLSEVRFKNIFERANIGIAVADLNGSFIMTNPAFQAMIGYSEQELLQMGFQDTGHPDDLYTDQAQYKALIAGEIEGYQVEKRNIRRDGEVIQILLTVSLVHDFQGKPMYGIGIIEDITNRKRQEEKIKTLNNELAYMVQGLESANNELESFSYSVSHDLRAPLRAINGFSKILVDEYGPQIDDEGNRLIHIISSNARKMGSLIDDLLSFSQLSRQAKRTQKVDLNKLVKDILNDLELQYPVSDIVAVPHSLPVINADRNLLRQALINIITNALKFSSSRKEPEVIITAEVNADSSTISVKDNGVGFDMKYHEKLFKVFQRLHTDQEFKGTGVGLAIAERIVNHHDGKIWAESQPDAGATFNIELPLQN